MGDLTLYIVRGVPGSGKSEVAEALAPGHHYEANDYFCDKKGNFTYNQNDLDLAHKQCYKNVITDMMSGVEKVAVANTFVKKWEFEPYVDVARKLGYKVAIVICRGEFVSAYDVPDEKVKSMLKNFEY